ncbi:MAG: hypothetical protein K8T26_15490 [Lentisphaerae bacterium]|nr:hypothetical protein [Lentisphaerota bacterium]
MLTSETIRLALPSGLGRELMFDGQQVRTTALTAPPSATRAPLTPAIEFALTVDGERLTSSAFTCATPASLEGGTTFITHHALAARDLQVRVTYSAHAELGVLRKRLAVTGRGRLTAIELEGWDVAGARGASSRMEHKQIGMGPLGIGQPIFWNGFFLGVEHPGAENWVTPAGLLCRFPCNRALSSTAFASPPCVLGTAHAGREADAFQDYIDRLRPHAEPPFVALVNNWYQFGRVRHRGIAQLPGSVVLDEMRDFSVHARDVGLPLDFYCLDDPWADAPPSPAPGLPRLHPSAPAGQAGHGLWDRLSPELFPGGLPALVAAAAPMRIGLWVGPIGGYLGRGPLVAFGKSLGYETWTDVTDDSGFGQDKLCAHGTHYHAHLRESLAHWARAGVRYWKFDGIEFHCNDATHGHDVGPGACTAQMDAWIELMQVIRRTAPDSLIAFTTGSNPSPWWLLHVDFVWRGGGDDRTVAQDAPKRERFATYIDDCLHLLRHTAMPVASVVTFGLIQNAALTYASDGETPEAFERALWLMVARGTHHHDLYVSPDTLSPDAWAALARALHWARRQRRVLARSRMILGEPMRGDVYGFASWRDGRGIVALRNPSGAARTLTTTWRDLLPEATLDDLSPLTATPAYGPAPRPPRTPAPGDTVHVDLPPFGVAVWDVHASP